MVVMNKVKEIVSKKTTRKSLKDIKFAPDLIERVRLERKALIPHMIQLRDDKLAYDKLSAGGKLFKLSDDGQTLVLVTRED